MVKIPGLTLEIWLYSGTPVQRCPSRTTAPLKRLFFCARMPFTLLRTPEERYDGKNLADGRHLPPQKRPLGVITIKKRRHSTGK